jgi:hypothetical protein
MSDPDLPTYAYAHPDDVVAVFDHPAVWIDGTAIQVKIRGGLPRGTFFVARGGVMVGPYAVPSGTPRAASCAASQLCHECGSSCGGKRSYDGRSAAWCLKQYELTQRDDPTVDLSIPLTPRQIAAARYLWRQVLLGLVQAGSCGSR